MRNAIALWALLLSAAAAQAEDCGSLDVVRWMTGTWMTAGEGQRVVESWTVVGENTFEGYGAVQSAESGEITESETLRLVAMSGGVYYIAKVPENELPVPFQLTSCDARTATFENPAHDFPKRLIYRQESPDRMTVSVRGDDDQGFTLDFRRVPATSGD